MWKLVVFLFLIVSQCMFSQTKIKKNISAKEAILLSATYKERASWFQEMPQYNQDSSDYYFDKSIKLLEKNKSKFTYELFQIYGYKTDRNEAFFETINLLFCIHHFGFDCSQKV